MMNSKWLDKAPLAQTEQEKVDVMVEFVTEWHLDHYGGYPYDGMWRGDEFIVAGLDDAKDRNRTELMTYTKARLLRWYERARKFQAEHEDETFEGCLLETDRT